ncbi:T9SS type A sorting domain-containing protein [Dyadobacter flavalbus]|uniref:T9SS type A sorting domain-containing protein n=1 Tax=Dyadobacter flavalbus TaxID=2579942 RepID=A0A5M8R1L1_9BACT|nr:T9SS type A sorting domain-containing protein [Dyadobacter flavalbus]KAA6440854.1 T9SS type A sorting domain-containing protein [Dyadobacter flavalbus]
MLRTFRTVTSLFLMLITSLCFAQNTPIDNVAPGPHLFFNAKNVVTSNDVTPSVSFDIYMSVSQAYVDYLNANGAQFGLQSVDVAWDVDFGTDGTVGPASVVTNSGVKVSNQIQTVQAQLNVQGNSPAGYDAKFKYTFTRTDENAALTVEPVKVASVKVTFGPNVTIGTVANGAKIQFRCQESGFGTGLSGSKWGDLSGNNRNIVGTDNLDVPLPVRLVSFNAVKQENVAFLSWITTEEVNSEKFDVQRSTNGKEWKTIATIAAKGDSKELVNYEAIDKEPVNGLNLYRLHMIDKDGSSTFSKIQSLNFDVMSNISIYPNPVSEQLSVLASDWNNVASVQILNANGLKVYESSNDPIKTINVEHLPTGMYIVKVTEKNNVVNNYKILLAK